MPLSFPRPSAVTRTEQSSCAGHGFIPCLPQFGFQSFTVQCLCSLMLVSSLPPEESRASYDLTWMEERAIGGFQHSCWYRRGNELLLLITNLGDWKIRKSSSPTTSEIVKCAVYASQSSCDMLEVPPVFFHQAARGLDQVA